MIGFLRRLKRFVSGGGGQSFEQELIRKKVISVGEGCDISGMQVMIFHNETGRTNIEIGNNTCIKGILIIYRPDAKIKIGDNVYIGPNSYLECAERIEIGNDILISMQCNLIDTNSHSLHSFERVHDTIDWQKGLPFKNWDVVVSKGIVIKDKSWMGLRSIITKGVTLAEGTIVAAGSVVSKNTDPYTVVAGNPAKFIKTVD